MGFLAESLICPSCGAGFGHRGTIDGYDILTCRCSRYPVVAGIPIIKREPTGAALGAVDDIIRLIEAGRNRDALRAMIMPPLPIRPMLSRGLIPSATAMKWVGRLERRVGRLMLQNWERKAETLLLEPDDRVTARDLFDLYFRRSGWPEKISFDYFAFRYGQPRHLVGLAYASLVREARRPVLDVACGAGLLTPTLIRRAAGQPVVGLDGFFFLLYVAKHWIAPEAEYVCCTADSTLPFEAGTFSAAFCSDAFFYFRDKAKCVQEVRRIVEIEGLILLVWLKNALHRHLHPGQPLVPEGYEALVADMPHRLVADSDVLARYLSKNGPSLAKRLGDERLAAAPTLSIIASGRDEAFQDYGTFEAWPHGEGRIALNPIYVETERDETGRSHLRRKFPSAFYEEENEECKTYLPEVVRVGTTTLDALARGQRTPDVERLVEQFVAIGLPERY